MELVVSLTMCAVIICLPIIAVTTSLIVIYMRDYLTAIFEIMKHYHLRNR